MPKRLEQKLRQAARKRGYSAKRTQAYVYGTLANLRKRATRKRK